MNLGELVEEVKLNLGNREDLVDNIPAWINLGLEKISEDIVFAEWEATAYAELTEGVRKLGLPSLNALYTVKLVNGSGEMLERVSSEDYDKLYPEAHTDPEVGEPEIYTQWGRNIEVYPVPDTDYTLFIRFIQSPPKLKEDEEEPLIPYDRLIIAAATVVGFTRLGQGEEAAHHHQIYGSEIQSARKMQGRATDDYIPKMRGYKAGVGRRFSTERGRVWGR